MEDDENDFDNLFEDRIEEAQEESENIQDKINPSTSGERVAVPTKRVVRNPRLKFNPERLCGERGIPVLMKHFENVKFKGKGYEKEDLNKLMATLEHWTHRLFPSMKFEDCLKHIEHLGKKRPVKTCLRKIRLDMPILNNDFVHEDEDDEQEKTEDGANSHHDDAFDRLIGQSQPEMSHPVFASTPITNKSNSGHVLGNSFGKVLTDEQKQRMEHNRMLAIERRKAKMAAEQTVLPGISEQTMKTSEDPFETLLTNEVAHCDKLATEQAQKASEDPFESLLTNQESTYSESPVLNPIETDLQESDSESLLSHFKTKTKDDELGLDDLMDLVDEDETLALDHPENSVQSLEVSEMVES